MKLVYAKEKIKTDLPSIFLAGPSPRSVDVLSWRIEAIKHLSDLNFNGYVFIPEPRNGKYPENYNDQIEWEDEGLNNSDCILFWIPRNLDNMLGLTTNDEWGYWKCKEPNKLVLGFPDNTPKVRYQKYYADKLNIPFSNNLKITLQNAINKTTENRKRIK